jgi:hypothetical protein
MPMELTDKEFEDEVRRIARLLWPAAEYNGAAMIDGQERDGVFVTEDAVHLVECTVSRRKDKADEDATKLAKLSPKIGTKHPTKIVKCWFITREEPTADQRAVIGTKKVPIVSISFDQFRSKLVDAKSYISHRREYPFGSARDLETDTFRIDVQYVPLDAVDSDGDLVSVNDIVKSLRNDEKLVVVGDYGAGKSSTLREIFFRLSGDFLAGRSFTFPVLLNLRDHHGQTDVTEALERHARNIGYSNPTHLVRAWRAGYVILMLDGFDEIAAAGWAGKTKTLRDLRYRSMELIREFVRANPGAVVIAGRSNFFDNDQELRGSLAVGQTFKLLQLKEFTSEQVVEFLSRHGWKEAVPAWLPSRPLLLGYLASRNLLAATLSVDAGSTPAKGWHHLLQRIAEREAELEAGLDAKTIRTLIERVGSLARNTLEGLGPLFPDQLTEKFVDVCGYPPDDRGAVLLQRLPGLARSNAEDGSRRFVDIDFAAVAKAGDVFNYVRDPYNNVPESGSWQSGLPQLAVEVVAVRLVESDSPAAMPGVAAKRAASVNAQVTLASDCVRVVAAMREKLDGERLYLKDVMIPELIFDDPTISVPSVTFQDALIGALDLAPEMPAENVPHFERCYFGRIEGRTGLSDLPASKFVDAIVDTFDTSAANTHAILQLELPVATKVVLTLLKKLFVQAGSGRRESALYRGLDLRSQAFVPSALELLRKEGFVTRARMKDQTVWLPNRQTEVNARALRMLAAPHAATDDLLQKSVNL